MDDIVTFSFLVVPVADCGGALKVALWFIGFATPLHSALFLLRVWAVFYGHRVIVGFFTLLWLATFASFGYAFSLSGFMAHIAMTKYCFLTFTPPLFSLMFIVSTVYDTLVFIAITLSIILDSPFTGWRARSRVFFTGEMLGHISRSLLQTGQVYYL